MTIPENPGERDLPVSEVPDPVKATAPEAEPAPDEKDKDEPTDGPVVAVPGGAPGGGGPVPPVPPVPHLGSGH